MKCQAGKQKYVKTEGGTRGAPPFFYVFPGKAFGGPTAAGQNDIRACSEMMSTLVSTSPERLPR